METNTQQPVSSMRMVCILIGVAAFIAVAIFGWTKLKPSSPIATSTPSTTPSGTLAATPTTTVSPTETSDSTTAWKVYTNEKYGFEFRYPSNWTESETAVTNGFMVSFGSYHQDDRPLGASVYVRDQKPSETLESIKLNTNLVTWESGLHSIGGQTAIVGIHGEFAQSAGYVIYKGKVYTLGNELITNKQILSTFKFTK